MRLALKRNRKHPAERYAERVIEGKEIAGKYVRLACERHVNDFKTARQRGYTFDEAAGQMVIDFFQLCRHSKGKWAGEVIELAPWQQFIVWCLFGWIDAATLLRRFREALILVGRKNGKSTFISGVGLYLLSLDGEPGAEVYAAATKRDQARIIWDESKRMRDKSPDLAREIKASSKSLYIPGTASKFEALSKDSGTHDGLNVHAGLIDELHAHKDRDLLDVLDTGTGSRDQPLMVKITTAGDEGLGVLNDEWDYAGNVLDGIFEDERLFAYLATLDDDDDWRDRTTWAKANPNLGVSVSLDDLERKATKAERLPAAEKAFRQKHLNQRTEKQGAYLDLDLWKENGAEFTRAELAGLKGRKCYAAIDVSQRIDLTAATLVFPPVGFRGLEVVEPDPDMTDDELAELIERENRELAEAGDWYCLSSFWVPADNIADRVRNDKVPYDKWCDAGHMVATPGNEVDYRYPRKQIEAWRRDYQVELIGFDPWRITETAQRLEDEGATMVELRQGARTFGLPMDKLPALLKSKRFRHGGQPVLQWCAGNLVARLDPNDNPAPDRRNSREKIDGIVAALMSLRMALVGENSSSVYDGGGGLKST